MKFKLFGRRKDSSSTKDSISSKETALRSKANTSTKSSSSLLTANDKLAAENVESDSNEDSKFNLTIEEQISYASIPILEQTKLPRGGVSVQTESVGRIQFGIPPETIKDSMNLGLDVPVVYIVPVDRFCREMGPALGVNLAEFEFPAYFNFFVQKRKCTLIVDTPAAEESIRTVFGETLLGPTQFRSPSCPIPYEDEDFAPEFPEDKRPDFYKELKHFRIMPDGKELVIETLLNFVHFKRNYDKKYVFGQNPPIDEEDEVCNVDDDAHLNFDHADDEENFSFSVKDFSGKIATVYPQNVSKEAVEKNPLMARTEIFVTPGGVGYVIHDINDKNIVIARALLSSRVYVPDSMIVDGYGNLITEDLYDEGDDVFEAESVPIPPSFYPPSFGVTVLGNSHGFDKSGSTSGYVLWVNGRGIMIDPPPYSTATLERDGIRAGTIVGIILTHCHADHDAGAFQKVLRDRPVVVITTPTIYKSFIRKYAALSGLSEGVLMHSHRHRPAIIGKALKFQGATFYFKYSLHTIPCVGFRVEWRRRSIVFTGDHFNSPDGIEKLREKGVLSSGRKIDLLNMPLQDTDLLLHEAGAPPIHTPLAELQKLPDHIKKRMYIVHTSALPEDCGLKIAPTGTRGTIRLDHMGAGDGGYIDDITMANMISSGDGVIDDDSTTDEDTICELSTKPTKLTDSKRRRELFRNNNFSSCLPRLKSNKRLASFTLTDDDDIDDKQMMMKRSSQKTSLVMLRPTSSSDAWFILNLMSSVPFFTSLSYTYAMEVLETARVDAFCHGDVVVPKERRKNVLCVFWEGVCTESIDIKERDSLSTKPAVWFAGDWTGPRALQPDLNLSGESPVSHIRDVVAVSNTGVKVITIEYSVLHDILLNGSLLFVKYNARLHEQTIRDRSMSKLRKFNSNASTNSVESFIQHKPSDMERAVLNFNLVDLLDHNSTFKKLRAVQKRYMESIVEGPYTYEPYEKLWLYNEPVEMVFLIVYGSARFVPPGKDISSFMETREAFQDGAEEKKDAAVRRQTYVKAASIAELFSVSNEVSNNGERITRRKSTRQRFTNKIFSRLYMSSEKEYGHFEFTRGNFVGDVSRIVGDLAISASDLQSRRDLMSSQRPSSNSSKLEREERNRSSLVAGKKGCVVVSIRKENLRKYLDNNPGLLLCLLGTEVVV